jgi:hypothetical protein
MNTDNFLLNIFEQNKEEMNPIQDVKQVEGSIKFGRSQQQKAEE